MATRNASLADSLAVLIDEAAAIQDCLVLADFSPKNILWIVGGDDAEPGQSEVASPSGDRLALVDFETAHFGDPAFDVGFFMSHLLLKSICWRSREPHGTTGEEIHRFARLWWDHYSEQISRPNAVSDRPAESTETQRSPTMDEPAQPVATEAFNAHQRSFDARSAHHLAACGLARIRGKSPVDYLDESLQAKVSEIFTGMLTNPPPTVNDFLAAF